MNRGRIRRTVHWTSAPASVALFAAAGPLADAVAFNPALCATGALSAAWIHLLTASGYRRVAFWLASACATIVVSAALGLGGLSLPRVHSSVALMAAVAAFGVARLTMLPAMLNARRFAAGFVVLLSALLFLPGLFGWVDPGQDSGIRYQGELDQLISLLHPAYRSYGPQIEDYVEEIAADRSLSREQQERLIGELNRQIETLQNDIERYQAVQTEKEAYAEEVARLRRKLEQIDTAGIRAEDLSRVTSYREAVRPAVPLVRDFAVKLAAEHPGTYYSAPGSSMPSREGLLQVLTIHRYVAASWKYVNDPRYIRGNYYSPADRTIAAGLVGDCDDFATLMASAVEAVGGRARILHGICADGAHAWAEVYIGNRAAWQQAMSVLGARYPRRRISHITPQHANDYWLSLDWQVGVYSCGNSPRLQYQSG
ncbi:MAG: hypothetical protein EA404_02125 [Spirochaetaceae bacterium]|nr:MAG: hypothetical protein EA404_02125 [Spirochaetaceae bacterium]